MMNTATLNSFPGINNFIICFYCSETFRSLSSLLKHSCSAEQNISIDLEPFEILSDTNSVDFDQSDSVNSTESSSDEPLDFPDLEIVETESNASDVDEASFSESETEPEKALIEEKTNETTHEISEQASDAPEKQLSAPNCDVVTEVSKLASATPEIQLSESNSDAREDTNVSNKACNNQLPVSDAGQKVTELNDAKEFNGASLHILSKAIGYCEMQANLDTSVSCSKSPSAEVEFQSSHTPLYIVEYDFQRHNDTQMECISTDRGSSSETSCDTSRKNNLEEESNILKHNANEIECKISDKSSEPSSKNESNSLNIISKSCSSEMDLDCVVYSDNQTDSDSLLENKSDELKHDNVQKELNASESNIKSLLEKNLNITKQNSEIVKSCYVKVQDIFKSLVDTKVSPEKIFSWKKKYHVCDVCNKFFRLRSDLNIHYLIHTTVKPYSCNLCNKSFLKQCNLFAHHLVHTIKRKHACSICKKSFLKKSLLLRHILTHTKERPYICKKCDKSYATKWSLNEHYLTHSDERPYVCEICNARFANKRYLRKHYHAHQSNNKDHVCEFCFRTFKRKHHLEEHYNIHTNDTPHKCKICNKTFHLLLTLNNHYTVVHRNQYSRIFSEIAKTSSDCKTEKNPVIQKIEIAAEVEPKKTPVIEKPSIIHIRKESLSYTRARRKPLIPKRYLQPDKNC